MTHARTRGRCPSHLARLTAALALAGLVGTGHAADVVWYGGDGDWEDGALWLPVGEPGGLDHAFLPGGFITLSSARSIFGLTMSGSANLAGAGSLTVTDTHSFSSAFLTGSGTLTLQGSGTISNTLSLDDDRVVNHAGSTVWTAGSIYFNRLDAGGGGGTFNNLAGAEFVAQGNNVMENWTGSSGAFNNAGTFRKAVATGTTTVNNAFNNSGTVVGESGNLLLNGGGTHTGSFNGAGPGTVTFGRGAHALLAPSTMTGRIAFDGFNWGIDVTTIDGTLAADVLTVQSDADVVLNTAAGAGQLAMASSGRLRGGAELTVTDTHSFSSAFLTGSGTLTLQGSGTISNTLSLDDDRVVNHAGSTVWTAGSIYFNRLDAGGGGGTFNNLAGAEFVAQGNNVMENWTGSSGAFNNAGTFRKAVATGTTTVNNAFNNSGTVVGESGNLLLNGGGTHTGSFNGAGPGTVTFGRGAHALLAPSTMTGRIAFDGFNWGIDVTTIDGTLAADVLTVQSDADVVLNTAAGAGQLAMASSGRLRGGAELTVTDTHSFSSAFLTGSGTLTLQGSGTISNTLSLDDDRVVNHAGSTVWTAGSIYFNRLDAGGGGGTFNNLAGAEFVAQGNNVMENWTGSSGAFNNAGTFRKAVATGTTTVNNAFNNSGTVVGESGNLLLNGGGTHTGSFNGAGPGTVTFGRGAHALLAPSTMTGRIAFDGFNWGIDVTTIDGTLAADVLTVQSDADVVLNTAAGAGQLAMASSGRLRGGAELTVTDTHSFSSAFLTGSGTLTLQGSGTISNTLSLDDDRVVNHAGSTVWTAGSIYFNRLDAGGGGGTFNNLAGAEFVAQGNNVMENWTGSSGAFNNAGTFRKAVATGTTRISSTFRNTGLVDVQTGTLQLAAAFDNQGTVRVAESAVLFGSDADFASHGLVTGDGTLRTASGGVFVNAGLVSPGDAIGQLDVDGSFEMDAAGSILIELAGLADFDLLAISDDISLGGTLSASFVDGFSPVLGDSFTVITFAQVLGGPAFDRLEWSGLDPSLLLTAQYNPGDVTLTVAAIPEPGTWALMLGGLAAIGSFARRRVGVCGRTV